jgi:predicted acylesterase/phospholipase RssA
MALLSGEPRSATVRAIRDSALLRVPAEIFQSLLDHQPRVAADLARLLAGRLRETSQTPRVLRTVRTIGLAAAGSAPLPEDFAPRLAAALGGRVLRLRRADADAALAGAPDEHRLGGWLNAQEEAHDFVVYQCDAAPTAWTLRVLRQVDVLLIVGRGDADAAPGEVEQALAARPTLTAARQELVLLHPPGAAPHDTRRWLASRRVAAHHHLRQDAPADYARLARALAGRSIGVVLSGGGARGFAHIGALRALAEAGIAIDHIGGTSMGAIIAGQVALGWSPAEMLDRNRQGFGAITAWRDFTFPAVALLRGRAAVRLLQGFFGDTRIEDLWLPYFCVSTNLSRARVVTHDEGPLWLWTRASCSVPGIGPPVPLGGDLLVDGGVLNNMPVDIMRARCPGTVIAVDATAVVDLTTQVQGDAARGELSGWPQLLQRLLPWSPPAKKFPDVFSILLRTAAMSSAATMERMTEAADVTLRPPTDGINPLDWRALERVAELGYRYTIQQIEKIESNVLF